MTVLDNDGIEWEVNKHGVIYRIGGPDVIAGCNVVVFADYYKQKELCEKYPTDGLLHPWIR